MGFVNLGQALFQKKLQIPQNSEIVFVSDAYQKDYAGGAELTTEALLEASPLNIFRVHSKNVTMELLQQGVDKYWIFGNFAGMDQKLIPSICANLRYSVIEYDYKYCKYRSPEKHEVNEQQPCSCNNEESGLMISAFYHGAKSLWWMSEKQQEHYNKLFPFLASKAASTVLSSVFNDETFATITKLREKYRATERKKWIVMGSPSWIKGTETAKIWCEQQGHEYEVVWGLPYGEVLEKLATAEGLVFLPPGGDTCPRMVIEAKLLGCKLHLNENVQHKDEIWFNTDNLLDTESYLYMCRDRFWNGIKADMSYQPTISGYTTTKDCIDQDYPFTECIQSLLGFCDEVVAVDGGSTDGTWEKLQELAKEDSRVVVHQQKRDWNHPRFALFDGAQKALARSLCSSDFCWQQDSDEIVHERDYDIIKKTVRHLPKNINLLALPVIEYWGGPDKIRMDITLWKWRLSRNLPQITHGIPEGLREFDENGELYSKPGCDGCFYIKSSDNQVIPCANFFTPDMEQARQQAMTDPHVREQFQSWFSNIVENLPPVHHFSWFNLERKISTYKNYWSKHWESLYNVKQEDTSENNMFFDKPWSDVTEDDIKEMSNKLKNEMGGWVFHNKVDFSKKTPSITVDRQIPLVMNDWVQRNS